MAKATERKAASSIREALPYRPCVGIMVLNRDGLVWAGHRIAEPEFEYDGSPQLWQMPQGGIDKGEDPLPAAQRELYEETGMRASRCLPRRRAGSTTICRAIWSASGSRANIAARPRNGLPSASTATKARSQINPPPGGHAAEFDRWAWKPMAELPELIVPFKRNVYEQVVAAFRHLA